MYKLTLLKVKIRIQTHTHTDIYIYIYIYISSYVKLDSKELVNVAKDVPTIMNRLLNPCSPSPPTYLHRFSIV